MVKVIASSVRKGNVLDLEGRLAVVMHAENIHPGKGTPVTHLELRRISDGVKLVERYRTTDQVERAYLDEKDYNYLYEESWKLIPSSKAKQLHRLISPRSFRMAPA